MLYVFFFFNDTATTEIYTLSLHDALPIWRTTAGKTSGSWSARRSGRARRDRKSTRLNSSHHSISYAVFCLKKKNTKEHPSPLPRPKHPTPTQNHAPPPP